MKRRRRDPRRCRHGRHYPRSIHSERGWEGWICFGCGRANRFDGWKRGVTLTAPTAKGFELR